jgi:L-seryl-tRNA(Ser) seleniumtransferase
MADKSSKKVKAKSIPALSQNRALRNFPSISSVLEDVALQPIIDKWSFAFVSSEAKKLAARWKKGSPVDTKIPTKESFISELQNIFKHYERELIQPVINGTGVILHTNLGRAPISPDAYEDLIDAVTGYSNLEFDLTQGKRSNRSRMPGRLLAALSGAQSGMAVNNNAAAVYLIVANLAGAGREVIISRGQLVQIGGGFRIPEIIERSGAVLKEIGATNKTTLSDYQRAIGKKTGLILFVHKSNFVQKGFTEEPDPARISELAQAKKIPFCYDLGSGLDIGNGFAGKLQEPTITSAMRSDADLICFSGDKLLGGPQAGLIIGKEKLISALLKDPLYRTFRLDKLTIGLLERALLSHLRAQPLPCWEIASFPIEELTRITDEIVTALGSPVISATKLKSSFGGGSLPEYEFDSYGLKITGNPNSLSQKLLDFSLPVVCRTTSNGVLIDMRTVMPEQLNILIDAIKSCL